MSHPDKKAAPWSRYVSRLIGARLAAGLTQLALAKACGRTGNGWISMMENRHRNWPRDPEDFNLIAEVLGVPSEWLLYGRKFGSQWRVALGAGGPDVVLAEADPEVDVAFYPGAWHQGPGGPEPDQVQLVAFDLDGVVANGPPQLLVLDRRGRTIIAMGSLGEEPRPSKPGHKPRTDRRLVDADNEHLSESQVVGRCVQLKPKRAPSRPRRAK